MMVDGPKNSVHEVHCEMEPEGPDNPAGNGYYAQSYLAQDRTGSAAAD